MLRARNDLDLVNKWVLVKDFDLIQKMVRAFPNMQSHNLEGNATVGYVYVDPMAGMSMRIEYTCGTDGRDLVSELIDLKVNLTIRYSDGFSFLRYEVLSEQQRVRLGLHAKPDWLRYYPMSDLHEKIMAMRWLDPLRAKGFPYDVQVVLFAQHKIPEVIWARIQSYDEKTGIFGCTLLNESNQDFKVHKDENVEVIKTEHMEVVKNMKDLGLCLICKTVLDRNPSSPR